MTGLGLPLPLRFFLGLPPELDNKFRAIRMLAEGNRQRRSSDHESFIIEVIKYEWGGFQ